jgi:multidrug resistance efflux pump
MNRPRQDLSPSRPRLRLNVWVVGVLAASAAALTAWALTSRADAPPAANPAAATRTDMHYNFMGFADLEQGVAPLYPLQPGRVVKVFAHDGDAVEEGAPLFAMDDKAAMNQIDAAEADLRDAQLQLEDAQKLTAQHTLQIDGQKQAVEARKQEAAAGRAKAEEAERLHGNGNASAETDRAANAQAKGLEAAVRGEEAKLHLLELDDPSLAVRRAENAVDAKQSQLRKAQMGLRECTVWAPTKGVVERMEVNDGESLGPTPRQPAVMFAADGPRIVRAEVEQEWAGHVALGTSATIQDYSASGPTWHGKVTRLSDWYTHRRSILLEPMQFNDVRTLESIITLDPGQPMLRIGQRMRVTLGGGS